MGRHPKHAKQLFIYALRVKEWQHWTSDHVTRTLRLFVSAWAWFVVVIYVSAISWIVFSFGAALNPREIWRFFEKVLLSYSFTVFLCDPIAIALRFGISVVYARCRRGTRLKTVHPTTMTERQRSQRKVLEVWEHQK